MTERRALAWLTLAAAVAIGWIALPFAAAMLFGALLAFSLEPLHTALTRQTHRPTVASVALVAITGVLIVAAVVGFVTLFLARAGNFSDEIRAQLQPGSALDVAAKPAMHWLNRLGLDTSRLAQRLETILGQVAFSGGQIAASLASRTLAISIRLVFALLAMHTVLLYWNRITAAIIAAAPLRRRHTRVLLREFRRMGRKILTSMVVTALIQGVLAIIGYWIAEVPYPVFFGIATGIASLFPTVGTLLIWVPIGLLLLLTGHSSNAAFELAWGALVIVGLSDYVIRPKLVGSEVMPVLPTLVSLFGGLAVMGLPGLIVGPLVVALGATVLRMYTRQRRHLLDRP